MKRTRRHFTPEQKADIVNQIDTDRKNGMKFLDAVSKQDINDSLYLKWKKQLNVGIKSSLRNGKPPVDAEKENDPRDQKTSTNRFIAESCDQ